MHHRKGSCLYAKDYFYGLVDDNILIIIEFDLIISFIWEKKKEKKERERPNRHRCKSFSHEATNNAKKHVISYYI